MEDLKQKLVRDERYQAGLDQCLKKPSILLAPTNYCNFNCSYCSTKHIKSQKINMEFNLVTSIVDQAVDNAWGLSFGQTYEPFLHPEIDKIIAYVNDLGRRFSSATNALAIRDNVYDMPMDLLISLSVTKDDYVYRGTQYSFEKYKEKLHSFLTHRINNEVPGVLSLQIADYTIFDGDLSYNKHVRDINGIYKKTISTANWLGLELVGDVSHWKHDMVNRKPFKLFQREGCVIQVQPTKIMPNSYDAFITLESPQEARGYCDSCYTMMSIQADGAVAYCCCDPSANAIAGHINASTNLKEFWLGDEMSNIREHFKNNAPLHFYCTQCLANVSENTKPLLTTKAPEVVADILHSFGVESDLPWFTFPARK